MKILSKVQIQLPIKKEVISFVLISLILNNLFQLIDFAYDSLMFVLQSILGKYIIGALVLCLVIYVVNKMNSRQSP